MSLAPITRLLDGAPARRSTAAPDSTYRDPARPASAAPILLLGMANTALAVALVLLGTAVLR